MLVVSFAFAFSLMFIISIKSFLCLMYNILQLIRFFFSETVSKNHLVANKLEVCNKNYDFWCIVSTCSSSYVRMPVYEIETSSVHIKLMIGDELYEYCN